VSVVDGIGVVESFVNILSDGEVELGVVDEVGVESSINSLSDEIEVGVGDEVGVVNVGVFDTVGVDGECVDDSASAFCSLLSISSAK